MHKLTIHNSGKITTLCSNKQIDELFNGAESQSASAFPVRVIYNDLPLTPSFQDGEHNVLPDVTGVITPRPEPFADGQNGKGPGEGLVLFSVPKRHFKHAVDRNRVKRQLREAFSQHAHLLHLDEKPMLIAFIWLDNKHYPSSVISRKIKRLMERIKK